MFMIHWIQSKIVEVISGMFLLLVKWGLLEGFTEMLKIFKLMTPKD